MTVVGKVTPPVSTVGDEAVMIPVEAFISRDYARAEGDRLWSKVWQIAAREEEIPNVGDFVTYDVANLSITVIRKAEGPDGIAAYHNVCPHRGRRLTEGCGKAKKFYCRYHGWQWNLDGSNDKVIDREEWGGALKDEYLALRPVRWDRWGGFIFVNPDPDPAAASLAEYLETVPGWLDPFEFDKMRYKWRQWLIFPCNWKVALEAFMEGYHVGTSHPQFLRWSDCHSWSRADGKHSCFGNSTRITMARSEESPGYDAKPGRDPRVEVAVFMDLMNTTVGLGTLTTQTLVDASRKLVDVLPDTANGAEATQKMMDMAREMDARRGVEWPAVDPAHYAASGTDWHIFPNTVFLHGLTYVLGYRARPNGDDPDSCIFEAYALERYPEGEEPRTENVYQPDMTQQGWALVLAQDFQNMPEVQKGMKQNALRGLVPNPLQEKPVINFHRNLAEYMGTGAPVPFRGDDGS
ncbi:SRPBCC family protein [Novosphingobium bradum]|uniref:SRPBCC family protein n=1 Tax=Novosphingobium bradum TaxID=1737444 RepID=A0ABV7IRA3_9SPHN